MDHEARVQALYRHLDKLGASRIDVVPPLWRLLWRFGFHLAPPPFQSFGFNAVLTGGSFAIALGLFLWWISPQSYPLPTFVGYMAFISVAFGLAMATYARYLARRFQLGNWDDYGIEAGEDARAG